MKFEHGALGTLGGVIAILIGLNVMAPPQNETVAAKRVAGYVSGHASRQVSDQISDMVTAAGPQLSVPENLLDNAKAIAVNWQNPDVHALWQAYRQMNYDFKDVVEKNALVPRVALTKLPRNLNTISEVEKRKAIFFKMVLPLVLKVNERIRADRRRLWKIRYREATSLPIVAVDRLWLAVMAERYNVKRGNLNALFKRVDIVPPSLALAQAAEESGWGTSRFVQEGNAIFGQWTFSTQGALEPKSRDEDKNHGIKAFDNLIESVKAYVHNLNTHRAYREFRATRSVLRRVGAPLDGLVLAAKLKRYSQRGWDYVLTLRSIILGNGLRELDDARLRGNPAPEEEPVA